MAHLVLFHSVLGLRPVEHRIAAALKEAGHVVTLPDLYDGRTAASYEAGFELKDEVGEETIQERVSSALQAAPDDAVLAGVSFGAFLVGQHWVDRPRMPGALLIAGGAPWMEPRRPGLPVSAHIARPDPFDDETVIMGWAQEADGVALDLHRYDGVGHYFLDPDLAGYSADAAALCLNRAVDFLRRLD
jgi:dienelactone hydrolase